MPTRYTLSLLTMLIMASPAPAGGVRVLKVPRPSRHPLPAILRAPPKEMPPDPAAVNAVRRLLVAYSEKDLAGFGRLLTADFHFDSGDGPDGTPFELTREEELASAKHLFEGLVRASGERLPAARHIRIDAGPFRVRPEVDRGDPLKRFCAVSALRCVLEIEFEDGSVLRTEPTSNHFFLVRGDAAVLADGARATSSEWFVRRWIEGPAMPAVAMAGAPKPIPRAATADSDSAGAPIAAEAAEFPLALSPVENPAHGVFGLAVSTPAGGPASLEAFDVAGRRVLAREFVAEPGPRRMTLEPASGMKPGVYWLRLSHANQTVTARVVLMR